MDLYTIKIEETPNRDNRRLKMFLSGASINLRRHFCKHHFTFGENHHNFDVYKLREIKRNTVHLFLTTFLEKHRETLQTSRVFSATSTRETKKSLRKGIFKSCFFASFHFKDFSVVF